MVAFLGPPLYRELPVMLKCLGPELTQDVIKERMKHVGNLIRYILDETSYAGRFKDTKVAVCQACQRPNLAWQGLAGQRALRWH